MSDLVERLRDTYENWGLGSKGPVILKEAAGRISTLEAELQKAREAALEEAARLIDEGFDRPGILKKQDTCAHGKFGWEDCEMCAAAAIRALSQDKEARE